MSFSESIYYSKLCLDTYEMQKNLILNKMEQQPLSKYLTIDQLKEFRELTHSCNANLDACYKFTYSRFSSKKTDKNAQSIKDHSKQAHERLQELLNILKNSHPSSVINQEEIDALDETFEKISSPLSSQSFTPVIAP